MRFRSYDELDYDSLRFTSMKAKMENSWIDDSVNQCIFNEGWIRLAACGWQ